MNIKQLTSAVYKLLILGLLTSCGNYMPKPKGYLRFDLPEKEYVRFDTLCPYKFEYPSYGKMQPNKDGDCWYDLNFPQYNSTIYLSYRQIDNNLPELLEDTHEFLYKHTIKADAINEQMMRNKRNITGLLFDIGGNSASSIQFIVTDSVKHFLRGSLYFYATPNRDSLAPLIDFFRKDIEHLMETVEFENNKSDLLTKY
jgi:gliding motility-associated lipoprotein GldD